MSFKRLHSVVLVSATALYGCGQSSSQQAQLDKTTATTVPITSVVATSATSTATDSMSPAEKALATVVDAANFRIVYPTAYINITNPLLEWTKPPNTLDYDVIISLDSRCAIPIKSFGNVKTQTKAMDDLIPGTYYLCVWAIQTGSRLLPAVNSPLKFTIDVTAPPAATLDQTYIESATSTATISWQLVDGIDYYDLIIATDNECANIVQQSLHVTGNAITTDTLSDGIYYACLYSEDLAGNATAATNGPATIAVDTQPPSAPTAVSALLYSPTTTVQVAYTPGTDVTFATNEVMVCGAADCATSCLASVPSAQSPATFSGLIEGQSYYFCVRTTDQSHFNSPWTSTLAATIIDTTVPTDPADVSIASAMVNLAAVSISWTASTDTNFAYHNVKLCSANDCLTTCTAWQHEPTATHIYTGMSDGTYYACVQGVDLAGNVSNTSVSGTTVIVDTSAPTNPGAVSFTVDDVTVSTASALQWTASTDIHLSSYDVMVCSNAGCSTDCTTSVGATSPHTFAGLAEGTYYGCVRSTDTAGNKSSWIASSSPLIVDHTPPAPPSAITVPQFSNSTVAFTFTNGTDAHLKTHNVKACTTDCSSGCGAVTQIADGTAASISNLINGSSYVICVQSVDLSDNASSFVVSAGTVTIDTDNPTVPSAVDFSAYTSTGGNLTVTWNAAADLNLDHYRVALCTDSGCASGCTATTDTPNLGTSLTLTQVIDGVFYGCVAALDKANNISVWAASVHTALVDTVTPTAPTGITLSSAYSKSPMVSFSFTPGTDANLTTHYIKACTDANCTTSCVPAPSSVGSPANLINLLDNTTYFACVRAQDQVMHSSAWVSSPTAIIVDLTPPSNPTGVSVPRYSSTPSISVTYTPGTDTNLKNHLVMACASSDCVTDCLTPVPSSASPQSLSDLVDGGTYYTCVQAVDNAGNTSALVPSSGPVTIDNIPPGSFSITGPATEVASSSFTVTFSASMRAINYDLSIVTTNDCAATPAYSFIGITAPQLVTVTSDGAYYLCMSAHDGLGHTTTALNNAMLINVATADVVFSYTYRSGATGPWLLKYGEFKMGNVSAPITVTSSSNSIGRSSLALASSGKVYIGYAQKSGAYYDLYLADNTTGSFNTALADSGANGNAGGAVATALDSTNEVHMLQHYTDTSIQQDLLIETTYVDPTFNTLSPEIASESTADLQNFTDIAMAVTSSNHVELIYTYFNGANYQMAHNSNSNGGWSGTPGFPETINNGSCSDIMFATAALDDSDQLQVAYLCVTLSSGGDCRIYHATKASGVWVHTIVGTIQSAVCKTSTMGAGYRPSIAVDSNNLVHISYVNMEDNNRLYYASGQSGLFTSVATNTPGSGGYYSAIALNNANNAYILYLDAPSGSSNLRMVTNSNGSWITRDIDTNNKVTGIGAAAIIGFKGQSNW